MAEAFADVRATRREAGLRRRAEQLAAPLPPLLVAAERVAATVAQGVHGRRRVGVGETFWQFRQYQHGDESTAIDWRQSARSQRVFVRENEWEAAQSVWLWRDASPSMAYASRLAPCTKIERATLVVLALAALLARGGERFALLGEDRRASASRPALDRLALRLLAPLAAGRDGKETPSLPEVPELPRFARVVLVGDFLLPLAAAETLVRSFAGRGIHGHLLQVIDPAEEDLPYAGRARFLGLEGEGTVTVGRVESLRPAYEARFRAHQEGLAAIARAAGWSFASHRTDRPPQAALLGLYNALSGAAP